MTTLLSAALAVGLAALCGTAVVRASRPTRVLPPPSIRIAKGADPASTATRICRDLAVALTEGRTPRVTYTEGQGRRMAVEPALLNGETVWTIRVGTAVRQLCPDLHAVELAVAHEIREWREPKGSVDARGGVVL